MRLIDSDFTCPSGSNMGITSEAVKLLVDKGELPKNVIDASGYAIVNPSDYSLVIVEGRSLNYVGSFY